MARKCGEGEAAAGRERVASRNFDGGWLGGCQPLIAKPGGRVALPA